MRQVADTVNNKTVMKDHEISDTSFITTLIKLNLKEITMENISKNKIRASVLENYKRVALKNKGIENSQSDCCGPSDSNNQSQCCSGSDSNIFDSVSDNDA